MSLILSPQEIEKMRRAGRLAAQTLDYIEPFIKAGAISIELNHLIHEFTLQHGAIPAPLNYRGFPKSCCISINECICHGVPDETVLKEGDIVNVDVTCIVEGFYGDTSRTFFVGQVSDEARRLTECAQQAMMKGIEAVQPYGTTGDIGFATGKFVTRSGYHAVRDIGGHGIGSSFHTEPFVPSYGKKGKGFVLQPWTCITVEPMVNETASDMVEKSIDGSDIKYYVTADACLSAQFEHTILVTDTSYEILTVS